jgi:DNA-binding transcriptional ArsR family regulator
MGESPFLDMTFAMMAAKTVSAAVELGIVDTLGEGSRTIEELNRRAGTHRPSLRRLLRALAGLGVVEESEPGRYALTKPGRLLRTDVPGSMGRLMMARCAPEFWASWGELAGSIRTGQTGWTLAHGMPWLDYYRHHPDQWAAFNAHMGQHTRDAARGIIDAYDFSRFHIIADVGGGDGTLIAEILRAHPDLKGVVFDLPQVVSYAPAVLAGAGVGGRADTIAGDIFASVPAGADAYLMKFILHDWDDQQSIEILRNCRTAMPGDGRVLIIERVIPEQATSARAHDFLYDIFMLVATGGKERTIREYEALLAAAGLTLTGLTEPLVPFGYRLIEAAIRPRARGAVDRIVRRTSPPAPGPGWSHRRSGVGKSAAALRLGSRSARRNRINIGW